MSTDVFYIFVVLHKYVYGLFIFQFHGGYVETILFSWWNVTEVSEFIGSFFAIFIMALLYEG